ncbi:MAG: acetolactate decarboxylase [Nitrospirae bacterium]|nr:acetolactate decarboxylase [Nitrospirota bacterium]
MIGALVMAVVSAACTTSFTGSVNGNGHGHGHVLYQYSTLVALMEGLYDGDATVASIRSHGDFGLGTFNGLDGEMVVVDGQVYQAGKDGASKVAGYSTKTPFAVVVFFLPDSTISIDTPMSCSVLEEIVTKSLPSSNIPYAIRVDGQFVSVTARTASPQSKPYRKLSVAIKEQSTFEIKDKTGTLIGFYIPEYMKDLNVKGYHFHFISDDRAVGGHLLDCRVAKATVYVEAMKTVSVDLPGGSDFYDAKMGGVVENDVDKVEKDTHK